LMSKNFWFYLSQQKSLNNYYIKLNQIKALVIASYLQELI